MFVETKCESKKLGRAAQEFLDWSRDTGRMLETLPRRAYREIPSIVSGWQTNKPFKDTTMEVLALYDGPAWNNETVRYALRTTSRKIETYIQLLPCRFTLMPKPYASITQVAPDGQAMSLSIRRTAQDIPDSLVVQFGHVARYPQCVLLKYSSEPPYSFDGSSVNLYPSDLVVYTGLRPIDQKALIRHVSDIISRIFRGQRVVAGKHACCLRLNGA